MMKYLIYLDILGYDELAKKIAREKKMTNNKVRCNFIDGDLGVVEGEASDAVFVIDTGWKGAVETGGSQFASFIAIMTSLWQIISICLFNHSFFVINLPCSIWDIR